MAALRAASTIWFAQELIWITEGARVHNLVGEFTFGGKLAPPSSSCEMLAGAISDSAAEKTEKKICILND